MKGMHLNTIERFYIHEETSINNHLNDDHMISNNKIFKTSTQPLSPGLYLIP